MFKNKAIIIFLLLAVALSSLVSAQGKGNGPQNPPRGNANGHEQGVGNPHNNNDWVPPGQAKKLDLGNQGDDDGSDDDADGNDDDSDSVRGPKGIGQLGPRGLFAGPRAGLIIRSLNGVTALIAEETGLTPKEIRTQLRAGMTLEEIINEAGGDSDTLKEIIAQQVIDSLTVRLEAGKLTQASYDDLVTRLTEGMDSWFDSVAADDDEDGDDSEDEDDDEDGDEDDDAQG